MFAIFAYTQISTAHLAFFKFRITQSFGIHSINVELNHILNSRIHVLNAEKIVTLVNHLFNN